MRSQLLGAALAGLVLAHLGGLLQGTAVTAPLPPATADHVVLVTLDGARTEEIFGGLDAAVLQSTLGKTTRLEDQAVFKRFWADTPEARRAKLMPFFWNTLMRQHGSVAGNQTLGSRVQLTNRHRFSYPGYAEMLLGRALDGEVASNDLTPSPRTTVLEFARRQLALSRDQVALYGSWEVFNGIGEHDPGTIAINAGYEAVPASADAPLARLGAAQFETPTPWDAVRHDHYTFRMAMAHLAAHRPRMLYLALGETDDWAHDGRYDRVLEAYARTDAYLAELWRWIESQPDFAGHTHLLITTDHGRGRTPGDWRDHGEAVDGAEMTWMAFVSPTMDRRGEWRDHVTIRTAQVAGTLLAWLGLDGQQFSPDAALPVR